jgi:hypothetical protein
LPRFVTNRAISEPSIVGFLAVARNAHRSGIHEHLDQKAVIS